MRGKGDVEGMKQRSQGFLAGVLGAMLLFSLASPSLAALTGKTIEVFTGVEVFVDGEKLEPTDANGNPVETFVYNGTTYVPLRAVSRSLGKEVRWNGEELRVEIGKPVVEPVAEEDLYILRFDANGGAFTEGAAPAERKFSARGFETEENSVMPAASVAAKEGYTLVGWAGRAEMAPGILMFNAAEKVEGQSVQDLVDWAGNSKEVTLYAVWKK